jgi:hypothetical protein
MKLFKCQACAQLIYFENTVCEKCSHRLGYLPEINTLSALEPRDRDWSALAASGTVYRYCANADFGGLQLAGRRGLARHLLPLLPAQQDDPEY